MWIPVPLHLVIIPITDPLCSGISASAAVDADKNPATSNSPRESPHGNATWEVFFLQWNVGKASSSLKTKNKKQKQA